MAAWRDLASGVCIAVWGAAVAAVGQDPFRPGAPAPRWESCEELREPDADRVRRTCAHWLPQGSRYRGRRQWVRTWGLCWRCSGEGHVRRVSRRGEDRWSAGSVQLPFLTRARRRGV